MQYIKPVRSAAEIALRRRIKNLLTCLPMDKGFQMILIKALIHMRTLESPENIIIIDGFIDKVLDFEFRDDPPVPDR